MVITLLRIACRHRTWKLDPERLSQLDAFGLSTVKSTMCLSQPRFHFLVESKIQIPIQCKYSKKLNAPQWTLSWFSDLTSQQCRHADHYQIYWAVFSDFHECFHAFTALLYVTYCFHFQFTLGIVSPRQRLKICFENV